MEGVTQVVIPGEGGVFHNRLTHSLKVAQIARRLAERVGVRFPTEVRALGGVDPEVAEAAALAHDLGHPPFGHVTEKVLDELLRERGHSDGFEGNPQSFRILTKLAVRSESHLGLDLTRATLAATSKYPWPRGRTGKSTKKWGHYKSEHEDFRWSREHLSNDGRQTLEAGLMDLADDIAYSVHDAEDFFRAGHVPLDQLATRDSNEQLRFLESLSSIDDRLGFCEVMDICPIDRSYRGTRDQRAQLRSWISALIQRFTESMELDPDADSPVHVPPDKRAEINGLKQLTWYYVIERPSLATQQRGLRKVITDLFAIYDEAIETNQPQLLPPRFADELHTQLQSDAFDKLRSPRQRRLRLTADILAGMTDREALTAHRRLMGTAPGTLRDELPT